mmetsp:Transcript_9282/g.11962  ORF Transcript_9282/g.11962 Transcript_9282/m.11962 type:complete len:301 (-) Transcript_9282:1491-2393(-)
MWQPPAVPSAHFPEIAVERRGGTHSTVMSRSLNTCSENCPVAPASEMDGTTMTPSGAQLGLRSGSFMGATVPEVYDVIWHQSFFRFKKVRRSTGKGSTGSACSRLSWASMPSFRSQSGLFRAFLCCADGLRYDFLAGISSPSGVRRTFIGLNFFFSPSIAGTLHAMRPTVLFFPAASLQAVSHLRMTTTWALPMGAAPSFPAKRITYCGFWHQFAFKTNGGGRPALAPALAPPPKYVPSSPFSSPGRLELPLSFFASAPGIWLDVVVFEASAGAGVVCGGGRSRGPPAEEFDGFQPPVCM